MPNSEHDCHKCIENDNSAGGVQEDQQPSTSNLENQQQKNTIAQPTCSTSHPPPSQIQPSTSKSCHQNYPPPPSYPHQPKPTSSSSSSSSSANGSGSSSSSQSNNSSVGKPYTNDTMPPPPPRKLMTQCMCHYTPPQNLHNHHHQSSQHQGYYMKNAPGPSTSNCQPLCHYANSSSHRPGMPPPPNHNLAMLPAMPPQQPSVHHHQSHPVHGQQMPTRQQEQRINMPGPSNMYPAPHNNHHGSMPSSSNKYFDCKNLPHPCSRSNPMGGPCQMHQKSPCIKSMCCSIVPPPEKHHHFYPRPHCGAPVPSNKYDYMSKYPPPAIPGPSNSGFCSGCMRSNCLLKTQNPQAMMPHQMHQSINPPIPMIQAQSSAASVIPQIPPIPSTSQQQPTLCKNCKATESKPPMKLQVPPIPPVQASQEKPVDPAKYNIVNYGASTSKGTSSASSSSSSSSVASASNASQQIDVKFVNKKNPNCVSKCLDCSVGCEIEFPLDAVACIFDCLTEACNTSTDVVRLNGMEDSNIIASKYKHIQVPGSKDPNETFLTLAFEAAILALGKQRIMPQGLYSQHLICKQQDQLIARLRQVDLDQLLVEVIKNLSSQMMDGGPTSGFGESIHPESVPMHTLARFLFASLLNQHPDLAFKIGLRAMRFPIFENISTNSADGPSSPSSPYARWWTLGHLESQQCSLSSTMLSASKGDKVRLAAVLENARQNIHSSTHLFKLAQDAFRFATPENGPRSHTLLEVAFELGLQVMRMTRTCLNWRRREMVRWLVTCATQLGLEATLSIMQNWYELFTPTEATGPVATTIMSHSTIMRLNLNIKQQEELSSCARTLALQCATKDPPNCALNALTLCENDPMAFETAYHIVIDAANHIMTSSQLFTIARYMEHRGFPVRAYNLAILAMKNVHLAYNQDTHPAINDIHWACALSHTLGKAELSKMIPLVVKNVQCATVLSDILRRCSVPNPGMSHFNGHHRGICIKFYVEYG